MHSQRHSNCGAFCALLLLSLGTLAGGCIYSHDNGDRVSAFSEETYRGFSDLPEDTVILEAKDRSRERWTEVGRAQSSGSAVRFGGLDLHHWEISFRLDELDDWRCHANPDCLPTEGASQMILRARSPQSRIGPNGLQFYTFDQGAFDCTLDEVSAGSSLPMAYDECMDGKHERELTVWVTL